MVEKESGNKEGGSPRPGWGELGIGQRHPGATIMGVVLGSEAPQQVVALQVPSFVHRVLKFCSSHVILIISAMSVNLVYSFLTNT